MSNAHLGNLLASASTRASGNLARALRRAARLSLLWREEAELVYREGRSLTELEGVGPHLARLITGLLDDPPDEIGSVNRHPFLTFPEVVATLESHPEWKSRLLGDLHMHTVYSDGYAELEDLVQAAEGRGYEYIAVTDHSKGLTVAGGMDEERLGQQMRHIDRVNDDLRTRGSSLRVLKSIEMNLDPGGRGDMDPGVLERLDLVVGSFHSKLRSREDQTERFLAALNNPDVHVLGHPQGRMYNFRQGLEADWDEVFASAAALDKAVEIDSFPDRQDLDVALLEVARRHGVRVSIGSDSHHPRQLEYIEYGLAAAIKGGISFSKVLNFMPRNKLLEWARGVRATAKTSSGGAN
ncbi:MAG: PHP domain-containing protein [Actinomycetota bacterium]|nr:PHP domain-containing protein [Actinomycetota bacterium]